MGVSSDLSREMCEENKELLFIVISSIFIHAFRVLYVFARKHPLYALTNNFMFLLRLSLFFIAS